MGDKNTDITQKKPFELSNQQWEYLLARMHNQETVLFLGPGILPHPEHGTVENALHQYLLKQSEAEGGFIEKFYRDDKFFKLNDKDIDENLWYFMSNYRKFFEEEAEQLTAAREVMEQLVQLPFSLIITLCPNQLLEEAYGKELAFHTDFYNKKKKPNPYLPGSKDDPLIYYMRGKMSVDESMILSHNDLFSYLESIYEAKSMDEKFKADLKKAKYFVFLGLPLESWYMQLLMRLFDFHIVTPKILALKRFKEHQDGQKSIYEDLYKMEFHDHEGPEFIEQLFVKCQEKGLLRAPSSSTVTASFERDAAYFQERLKNGHHEQSLEALEELSVKYLSPPSEYQSFFQALTVGASNFRGSQRNYNIRLISKADFEVEEAKLIAFLHMQFQDLQELINE